MLETFTPAVCGSRKRQIVAQALFTVAADGDSRGARPRARARREPARRAAARVLAAAALALVAAAREAGLVRFPLPQARRQVPERWRFELPLPVWATGYGAGLGAASSPSSRSRPSGSPARARSRSRRPLPAAICFSLYGAGRAVMVVWPRRPAEDPTAAVERLTRQARGPPAGERGRARRLRRPARARAGGRRGDPRRRHGARPDRQRRRRSPSRRRAGTSSCGRRAGPTSSTRTHRSRRSRASTSPTSTTGGIRVVRWQDGTEVARIDGARRLAARARLARPRFVSVAARIASASRARPRERQTKRPATVAPGVDLGRPSLRNGRLAWHVVTRNAVADRRPDALEQRRPARRSPGRRSAGSPTRRSADAADLGRRALGSHLPPAGVGSTSKSRRMLARIRGRSASYWTTSLGPAPRT